MVLKVIRVKQSVLKIVNLNGKCNLLLLQVFKQPPLDVTDLGLKLSPDVAREKSVEVNGAKDWSETNGALPLARREPEGKDSDAKAEEEEDSKGSPVVGTLL